MPVIATYHDLAFLKEKNLADKVNAELNDMISNITFDILREAPGLVADASNGLIASEVLETVIIKNIDTNNYAADMKRDELTKKVLDYMFGYGPLQQYVEDEEVTDIDGTKYNEFIIKKQGERQRIDVNFGSEQRFDTFCKLIAIRNKGILNENDAHCRVVDEKARLRINISIKPRNVSGPSINIRKHKGVSYTLEQLVCIGMMNDETAMYFKKLACSGASLLLCGKGAAGKTTLMRAIINEMPDMERVLILESDPEVFADKPYCIEQRIKKKNEGGRSVTLAELVRDGLTMSLDTYVIGEIVGDEAWEFIKAAHTGHRGVATTHAASAEDALLRLVTLSKNSNTSESEKIIKELVGRSINIVVYLEKFIVCEIIRVSGYNAEKDEFVIDSLFKRATEVKS